MRRSTVPMLAALVIAGSAAGAFAGQDLAGTWTGTTWIPEQGEDALTLVLTKTETGYEGTLTDSFGFADRAELRDIKYENGELTCHAYLAEGLLVRFVLKVSGDAMTGAWADEEGETGEIKLQRQK